MLRAADSFLSISSSHTCQASMPLGLDRVDYINRQVDHDLLTAIEQGKLCSVLGAPKTGKSSLGIRTRHRLSECGYRCIGLQATQLIDSPQYYYRWDKQLISALWDSLFPGQQKQLIDWLHSTESLLPQQRLERFSRYFISQPEITEPIVVFIDSIESLLHVPFVSNDLFEWIWHCYCLRKIYPDYKRLNFVVSGNAKISSLTQNKQLIDNNQVILPGNFKLEETTQLQQNIQAYVKEASQILSNIFRWTNGQPLLTSKLCRLVITHLQKDQENSPLSANASPKSLLATDPAKWVDCIVETEIINAYWQEDDLSFLRESWHQLNQSRYKKQLRDLYHNILDRDPVRLDSNPVQSELLLSGLAVSSGGKLHVGNEIYRQILRPLLFKADN